MRVLLLLLAALPVFATPPVIATNLATHTLAAGYVGEAYSVQIRVNWNGSSAAVPDSCTKTGGSSLTGTGLVFNSGSCTITGIPLTSHLPPSSGLSISFTATVGGETSSPETYALFVLSTHMKSGSSPNWTWTSSGSAILDGREWIGLTRGGPFWTLGDTITMVSGGASPQNWRNDNDLDYVEAFLFGVQSGCSAGQYTHFVSDQAGSIPDNLKVLWEAYTQAQKATAVTKMFIFEGVNPLSSINQQGSRNTAAVDSCYSFDGIAFVTPLGTDTHFMCCTALVPTRPVNSDTNAGSLSNDVDINHFFIGNKEDYVYGSVEDWYNPAKNAQADINTEAVFYRGGNWGIDLEGDRWKVRNGVIVTTGYDYRTDHNPEVTCSASASKANPTVLYCPGLATAMRINGNHDYFYANPTVCPDPLNAVTGCYGAPVNGQPTIFAAGFAVLSGFTGTGWSGLGGMNGVKYLVYVDEDHAAVYDGWTYHAYTSPVKINSTGFGTIGGTIKVHAIDATSGVVQYGIASTAGNEHVVIENNLISDSGGSANIFLGGAWTATNNRGSVLSGVCNNAVSASNTCVIVLDQVANLSVGDWFWLSTQNGVQTGATVTNVVVASHVATANFSVIPPNVSIGQGWVITGSPLDNFNIGTGTGEYIVTSIGSGCLSGSNCFTFNIPLVGGVYTTPDGTYSTNIKMTSRSPACLAGVPFNTNCYPGYDRVGLVTNIAGTTVTLTGLNVGLSTIDPGTLLDLGASGTDLTVDAINPNKVTSVTHTFTIGDIGNPLKIIGPAATVPCPADGSSTTSGFYCGTYTIVSVSGGAAILNIAPCSSGGCLSGSTTATYILGYQARWNGRVNRYWKVSSNTLLKQPTLFGKAYVEIKHCRDCLFTGNRMKGNPFYDIFVELHKQGNDPWVNATNFEYSYNVLGDTALGSPARFIFVGQDPEGSNAPSINMRLLHNMSVEIPFAQGGSSNYIFQSIEGSPDFEAAHNTIMRQDGNTINYGLYAGGDGCANNPYWGTYLTSVGAKIHYNILGFGFGNGIAGICDPFPTGINNNLFWQDSQPELFIPGWTIPPWVASQGNAVVTTTSTAAARAATGFVGTCTSDTYLGCALDPSSAYKGSAPDGSDPGADVYAVQDRQNRWSETAGLLVYDEAAASLVNNPANWTYATTTTTAGLTLVNAIGSCTFQLFVDLDRVTESADTSGGNGACNRSGNTVVGQVLTIVFGHHAALTSGTTYAYLINDGANIMVGSFTTTGTGTAPTITTTSPLPGGTVGSGYSKTFTALGTLPITWVATGAPSGLSMNSSSGVFSGTPTGSGTSTIAVTATNAIGSDGPHNFSLTIGTSTCTFGLSPTSYNFPVGGGVQGITITASDSGCAWSTVPNAAWLNFSPSSGTGSGSTTAMASANASPARSATPTIGGTAWSATQDAGCSFSISPTSATFAVTGGMQTVTVTASDSACPWTASGSGFLSFSPASSTGSGSVDVTAASNLGSAGRSGSATIGGQSFAASQLAGIGTSLTGSKTTTGVIGLQ